MIKLTLLFKKQTFKITAANISKELVRLVLTSVELCESNSALWPPTPFDTLPTGAAL